MGGTSKINKSKQPPAVKLVKAKHKSKAKKELSKAKATKDSYNKKDPKQDLGPKRQSAELKSYTIVTGQKKLQGERMSDRVTIVSTFDGKSYIGQVKYAATSIIVKTEDGERKIPRFKIQKLQSAIPNARYKILRQLNDAKTAEAKAVLKHGTDAEQTIIKRLSQHKVTLVGEYHQSSNVHEFFARPKLIKALKDNNYVIALEYPPHLKIDDKTTVGNAVKQLNQALQESKGKGLGKSQQKLLKKVLSYFATTSSPHGGKFTSIETIMEKAIKSGVEVHLIDDQKKVEETEAEVTRDQVMAQNIQKLLARDKRVLFIGGDTHTVEADVETHMFQYDKEGTDWNVKLLPIPPFVFFNVGKSKKQKVVKEEKLVGERMVDYFRAQGAKDPRSKVFSIYTSPYPGSRFRKQHTGLKDIFHPALDSLKTPTAISLHKAEVKSMLIKKFGKSKEVKLLGDLNKDKLNAAIMHPDNSPYYDMAIIIPS